MNETTKPVTETAQKDRTCGQPRDPFFMRSPVCDRPADHDGRHHYDVRGTWGVRDGRGRYIVSR